MENDQLFIKTESPVIWGYMHQDSILSHFNPELQPRHAFIIIRISESCFDKCQGSAYHCKYRKDGLLENFLHKQNALSRIPGSWSKHYPPNEFKTICRPRGGRIISLPSGRSLLSRHAPKQLPPG